VVDSRPFLQDGEVIGLGVASDISPQLQIVLVEGTDVGGEDTMRRERPLGKSTIIKSTPPSVPTNPPKVGAFSDLCYTLQTKFRIDIHCKT
jgi:hypothetical protein